MARYNRAGWARQTQLNDDGIGVYNWGPTQHTEALDWHLFVNPDGTVTATDNTVQGMELTPAYDPADCTFDLVALYNLAAVEDGTPLLQYVNGRAVLPPDVDAWHVVNAMQSIYPNGWFAATPIG